MYIYIGYDHVNKILYNTVSCNAEYVQMCLHAAAHIIHNVDSLLFGEILVHSFDKDRVIVKGK